jgi:uncharacterized protein
VSLVIKNLDTGAVLASSAAVATSLAARMKGLLGTASLAPGAALVIRPCTGVHTFFMKYPIDVVFADREGRVVGLYHALKPWRATAIFPGAFEVVELPAGAADAAGLKEGNHIGYEENKEARIEA